MYFSNYDATPLNKNRQLSPVLLIIFLEDSENTVITLSH